MEIRFRPHHFLCARCFQGRGYSPAFVANFEAIMAELNATEGHAVNITITAHTDSICAPCPHRAGTACHTEEKISVLDHAHAEALQVSVGETLTWGQAKQRIAEKITLETFHHICSTCEWKALGICENVIKNL